ncbi:MAG: hypothetical protein ACK4Z3_14720, partial [Rhizobium rosettiformans]
PLSCHDVASYIGDIGSDRRQSGAFEKFGRQQLQSNSLALSRVPDAYVSQRNSTSSFRPGCFGFI